MDDLLMHRMQAFWMAQPGVRSFHIYGDMMEGWPERTMMIEVEHMAALQRVLEMNERKELRHEFMNMAVQVQSQMMMDMMP